MPMVKCYYCGKSFDRDKEPWEKPVKNRYAHKSCYDNKDDFLNGEDKILEKCKEIFKDDFNRVRIKGQIKKFLAEDRTIDGILKSLEYFYDVRGNDTSRSNGGIGIVPYVYDEALEYWSKKEERAKRVVEPDTTEPIIKKLQIKRERITKPINVNFFNLE